MNVEAGEGANIEFWQQRQDEILNGLYPLRRLLNGSEHGAVFTTECAAQGLLIAAVKIVPVERVTLAQLAHWKAAAAPSHPHLIRLLDTGLCQLGGRQFLFVVMEYADQTLSGVLLHRALTGDEVQEMLPPVLNALAFLHNKNLVQGQLKPANVLVVDDQVKLASDTVRPAGESRTSVTIPSLYDPPEAENGRLSPAGDIWALGVSLVEALTQRPPPLDIHSVTACLPTTLAPAFVDTIQRCLSRNPASRPTAADMEAQCKRAPQPAPIPLTREVVGDTSGRVLPHHESASLRVLAPTIATVLILLVAAWVGLRTFQSHSNSHQTAASVVQPLPPPSVGGLPAASEAPVTAGPVIPDVTKPPASAKSRGSGPAPPRTLARRPEQSTQTPADTSPSVVHEHIPIAPRSALETIHGHVKVAVRVVVDPSGDVTDALLENPGPSAYFARLARDAARKWKFSPADTQDSREWLLRFEFARDGITGHATTQHP